VAGGQRESSYFISSNRSKRSITVDLACERGQDLIRRLAARSDILIENFKVGDLNRKNLSYSELSAINPKLIYCSITGFGATGPRAEDPGYDYLIQARGGLMSLSGHPDGAPGAGPMRVGLAISDLTTGMNAAIAILAALHAREQSGSGQFIDIAMLDVQVSWLANQAQSYFATGVVPQRTGDQHASIVPYQPFRTQDGRIVIAVGNDTQFQRLCAVIGCSELAEDQRFLTNAARVENRRSLIDVLASEIAEWSTASLEAQLRAAQIPCGPIQSLDEVFSDPQVIARGMVVPMTHPHLGSIKTLANPVKFSATPLSYDRPPPVLGEHTDEVLAQVMGLTEDEIAGLRSRNVI